MPLARPVFGMRSYNRAALTAFGVSAFAVMLLPYIERLVLRHVKVAARPTAFRVIVEPLRYGSLLFSIYVLVRCTSQIPWLSRVSAQAAYFLVVAAVSTGGITAAIWWVRHIERVRGSAWVYPLIAFGVCCLYYLAITTYVFGVYPAIPANCRGRLPLTQAFFELDQHRSLFQEQRKFGDFSVRGPVYIIEQNSDVIYFATDEMDEWFERFVTVHALPRASIPYVRLERIEDGFPRVRRRVLPAASQPSSGSSIAP